ncbi:MAG: uracil-xanthine permease family protein [Defluviitaleaceae bacterium]|nr:uracil-xanthine permease family protein [Defluviitaleaceae bacterium]
MSTKAQKLGPGKTAILGLQHMFAMFGATILVPLLSGLSVQVTLISVGIGTLIFHFFAKGRVPAFLGSSFAFLVGIQLITEENYGLFAGTTLTMQEKLAYATGGILVSGFLYLLFALIVKLVGVKRFMRFLPPVVTAPTVILIGIMLAPFAINQSSSNIMLAAITLGIVIVASSWGKGMVKIIPILLGIVGAYLIALIMNGFGMTNADGSAIIDFYGAAEASIVGLPPFMLPRFHIAAILVMIPFAIATIAEHVGDMVALSTITGEDFVEEPGLSRTLLGDGVASIISGFMGGPASTTYGENVGVVALTKVFNTRVVQLAAVYAIVLGFSPMFEVVIRSIPDAIIGGASFMLYGMIAAVGIRNLVDNKVDVSKTKNLTIIAVMMVAGLGLRFANPITFTIGGMDVPFGRLGIAIAVVLGVVLNLILPEEKGAKEAK